MIITPRPNSIDPGDNSLPLDPAGWVSLAAGFLVILITFFTSYSHVGLFVVLRFKVNQQIGVPLLFAAMAALVGEVKLASNNRRADQSAREREARARMAEARAESEKRTKLIENEIERLAALESKLDSLLLSADSSSPTPPETDCS